MAVVNNYENVVARSSSGEIRNSPTYKRTFTVRCDNPDTSMVDIANAPGISYGDPHPHDASCFVTNVDVDADGDSMLIYTVSYSYTRPVGDLSVTGGTPTDPNSGGGSPNPNTPPDPLKIPEGYWSGNCVLQQEMQNFRYVTMTNGRPYTSGIPVDYSRPQLQMTNYYSDWESVRLLIEAVDKLSLESSWSGFDKGCVKITDVNWSFKQQTSSQQRLEYYEVQVTFQTCNHVYYNGYRHDLQGWPCDVDPTWYVVENLSIVKDPAKKWVTGWVKIPGWFPMIPSAGFQEIEKKEDIMCDGSSMGTRQTRVPIYTEVKYFDCEGEQIPYEKIPKDDVPENTPCLWPKYEQTTEEVPLDWEGKAVKPPDPCEEELTPPCIVIPWTENSVNFGIFFSDLFGEGPPYRPKPGPLEEPRTDADLEPRDGAC